MMKPFATLAAVACVALVGCTKEEANTQTAAPAKQAQKSIVIATEAAYPPFNDTDASGKIVGFDVDVMNALCAEMNADCQIIAQDWDGLIPSLLAGKYDAIIAGMSITPERQAQVDFSDSYFSNTIVWLAKNDGSFDPNDITNKTLASQRGTTGAAYITEKYDGKDGNRVQLHDTYTNSYLDMKAGRNHAVMAEKVSAADWLKQEGNGEFGLIGEEIDNNDHLGIAVRKGDSLKAEFDAALAKIKESGKLAEIEKAHFQ
ncbi:transporter substrate-binding domain-containing protein [Moraxella catarrhalis]|uniref:Extracellular solute-binding protein family 3 n=1 Tax=Moraxella catarrhalis TaxID=480 RepID=A0A198UNN6_MORCA|nr:transporter substrate-binding domain-containing protein [Moraxella catarrhalis]OAU95868.1 extracellular solute-binding protein family 3 [Moraxella catarrhalis]OAU97940.1 extracellular solute-binding protein family 3 [Moraxella catarrhalis]OAV00419.1 extracellular solute-binding protein family 3 [Moraxella catarrhalis]